MPLGRLTELFLWLPIILSRARYAPNVREYGLTSGLLAVPGRQRGDV